jgi:hypothetical protein
VASLFARYLLPHYAIPENRDRNQKRLRQLVNFRLREVNW